jgi:hypothetical protein
MLRLVIQFGVGFFYPSFVTPLFFIPFDIFEFGVNRVMPLSFWHSALYFWNVGFPQRPFMSQILPPAMRIPALIYP